VQVIDPAGGGGVGRLDVGVEDLQERVGLGVGVAGQDQVAHGLAGVGAAGPRADDQVAVEDVARPAQQPGLVEDAGAGVGLGVGDVGPVLEALTGVGEHGPEQVGLGALAQHDLGRHPDHAAPQGDHVRPEPALAPDHGPLDGEVVDLLAPPLLERQVLDAGLLADQQLGDAVVEGAPAHVLGRAVLLDQGQRRLRLDHDQGVGEGRPGGGAPLEHPDRDGHLDPAGHVQERPGGDQGGVQGQEPVLVERGRRGHEPGLDQAGVLGHGGGQVGEDDALGGQLVVQERLGAGAVDGRDQPGRLQLGAGDVTAGGGVGVAGGQHVRPLGGRRPAGPEDPVAVQAGPLGVGEPPGLLAVAGPLQLAQGGQRLQAPVKEPVGVAEGPRPGGHAVLVEVLQGEGLDALLGHRVSRPPLPSAGR
jgi:hypothetical protein